MTLTTQEFDSQNLNDEIIREYLQDHFDTQLYLQDNKITDLSWVREFNQLYTLKKLHVYRNRIDSFSWDDIPPLTEECVLWGNNLVSLPCIGNCNGKFATHFLVTGKLFKKYVFCVDGTLPKQSIIHLHFQASVTLLIWPGKNWPGAKGGNPSIQRKFGICPWHVFKN